MPTPSAPPPFRDPDVPAPVTPTLPASLDPAVPGDGRPFKIGDVVRHIHDAQDGSADGVVDSISSLEGLKLVPFGSRSAHLGVGWWDPGMWVLVKRPGPTDYAYMPPAPLTAGMIGEMPSEEFVEDCTEYFMQIADSRAGRRPYGIWAAPPRSSASGWYRPQFEGSITLDTAQFLFRYFITGMNYGASRETDLYSAMSVSGGLALLMTREQFRTAVRRALWNVFEHLDPDTKRCRACAVTNGQWRAPGDYCTHFACSLCGYERTEGCSTCTTLFTAEQGYTTPQAHLRVCTNCCSHVECACGCKTLARGLEACMVCKHTAKHCKCSKCEVDRCTKKVVRPCCGACVDHCQCAFHCMRQTHGIPLYKWVAGDQDKGLKRLLGTELETAGLRNNYSPRLRKAVKEWKANVVTDGSIGGKGMELVTQPAGGERWKAMIADLGEGFKEAGAFTTGRCGQHVHVDATDLGVWDLHRLIRLYNHLEWTLYDALPVERQQGTYSVPCGEKYMEWLADAALKLHTKMDAPKLEKPDRRKSKPAITTMVRADPEEAAEAAKRALSYKQYGFEIPKVGAQWLDSYSGRRVQVTQSTIGTYRERLDQQVADRKREKYDGSRYNGLNLHSYWHRGTVEFRHAHGTNNAEQITNWGIFVGSIVEYCKDRSEEDMAKILALPAREAALAVIDDANADVRDWLKTRWDKFTLRAAERKPEPYRDPNTGEV